MRVVLLALCVPNAAMQMAAEGGGSYYESFRRKDRPAVDSNYSKSNGVGGGGGGNNRSLMTDRSAYLGFLEVQLERVSTACLTAQGLDARMGEMAEHSLAQEERIANLTKVNKSHNTVKLDLHASCRAEIARAQFSSFLFFSVLCRFACLCSLRGAIAFRTSLFFPLLVVVSARLREARINGQRVL